MHTKVEENMTRADVPFEQSSSSSGENVSSYKTPFLDHKKGEGILINHRSVLKMRIQKVKLCWTNTKFEAKSQKNSKFATWVSKLMSHSTYSEKIIAAGIRKALNLSNRLAINRCPIDLDFLVSRWSTESHSFIFCVGRVLPNSWRRCHSDRFSCIWWVKNYKISWGIWRSSLDKESERKLTALNKALTDSKVKTKSTYSLYVKHFMQGGGVKNNMEFEAMLAFGYLGMFS